MENLRTKFMNRTPQLFVKLFSDVLTKDISKGGKFSENTYIEVITQFISDLEKMESCVNTLHLQCCVCRVVVCVYCLCDIS